MTSSIGFAASSRSADWLASGPAVSRGTAWLGQTGGVDADVVVIGAGALGLSTALHCAIAGRSVVVVERDTAGSQASGRAAGLFKSVQADELRTQIARRSITMALTFGDWAGVPLDVAHSGSFLVARTDAHTEYLRTEQRQSSGWGVDVRLADAGALGERVSYYRASGGEMALWCPEDIYIAEPIDLVRAYALASLQHGAEIVEGEAVTAITFSAGRVAGVETTSRTITAPTVVDAAGAWTRQVADLLRGLSDGSGAGQRIAVTPVRHQLLITEPTTAVAAADPIVRVVDAAVYLRPAHGGLMLGGFEAGPLPVDPPPTTDDVPLDLGILQDMAALVEREVPAATAGLAEHRAGLFTMSPDGRFVIGPVSDTPGLWVASGCNGSGFSSSPALGEALAHQITGTAGPIGIETLSPARFGALTDEALVRDGVWQYEHYYDPAPVAR
jgi:glycine/D-amino acid oxidase-like deaminating enzyme